MVESSGAGPYKDHPMAVPGRAYVSDRNSILQPKIDAGLCEPISVAEREAATRFNQTYDELFGPTSRKRTAVGEPRRLSYFEKLVQALGWNGK